MTRVDRTCCWMFFVLLLSPPVAMSQDAPPAPARPEHPADVAARAVDPWEAPLGIESVFGDSVLDPIDWGDRPMIGSRTQEGGTTAYRIWGFNFGMDQWEGSARTTSIRQRWRLSCDSSSGAGVRGPAATCSLETDLIGGGWGPPVGTTYNLHRYRTEDETLRVRRADWEGGVLDFTLIHPDSGTTEASIRFEYSDDTMLLSSFKAVSASQNRLSNTPVSMIEYRIPAYSYAFYVPFPMKGLKSSGQRQWNEVIETLRDEDQRVWDTLRHQREAFAEWITPPDPDGQILAILDATLGADRAQALQRAGEEATPDEERRVAIAMDQVWLEQFGAWLAEGGMSVEGQRRIIEFLQHREAPVAPVSSSTNLAQDRGRLETRSPRWRCEAEQKWECDVAFGCQRVDPDPV